MKGQRTGGSSARAVRLHSLGFVTADPRIKRLPCSLLPHSVKHGRHLRAHLPRWHPRPWRGQSPATSPTPPILTESAPFSPVRPPLPRSDCDALRRHGAHRGPVSRQALPRGLLPRIRRAIPVPLSFTPSRLTTHSLSLKTRTRSRSRRRFSSTARSSSRRRPTSSSISRPTSRLLWTSTAAPARVNVPRKRPRRRP